MQKLHMSKYNDKSWSQGINIVFISQILLPKISSDDMIEIILIRPEFPAN